MAQLRGDFHVPATKAIDAHWRFYPQGTELNPDPYFSIHLGGQYGPLTLHLFPDHVSALRDALSTALVEAKLDDPPAAVLHGHQVRAFVLGVQAVIDHVRALHSLSIDPAEFTYDEELRATAPFTAEEARPITTAEAKP